MLRDLYNLRVYRDIGEDALHSRAVRLASGFQEHLELSGHFFRASCRHCIEDAKSPQEDRAIGSEARAPILLNWGEGLICNCWFAFPNSLYDTPMAYNGTWVVTVIRMGSELGGAVEDLQCRGNHGLGTSLSNRAPLRWATVMLVGISGICEVS